LASFSDNDWIGSQTPNHPTSVNITRDGQDVWIRWYGGWGDSFVDHVMVKSSVFPQKEYVKPKPGYYIHYPLVPPNTTFEVYVFAKDCQSYQLLQKVTI